MKTNNIIAVTQCFQCGSWLCIEKILDKLADLNYTITIVGLGDMQQKNTKFKYIVIPYPAYNKYGDITCKSPIINFMWNFPLFVIGIFLGLINKPKAMIYNGLATGLTMPIFLKIFGIKNIIMYHSYIGQISTRMQKFLTYMFKFVDMTVVNSSGSYEDLKYVAEPETIVINNHYADDVFFDDSKNSENQILNKNPNCLTITYVGRIDEDKRCLPLLDAAIQMSNDARFRFIFAGAGSEFGKVQKLAEKYKNIVYLGYIKERSELDTIYRNTDILWSFADETYLGLPAIEALACGTPIIIPTLAAIKGSTKLVNTDLVPNDIGWMVNTNDLTEIIKLLKSLFQTPTYTTMYESCIKHAQQKYSSKNLADTVSRINALLDE